MVELLTTVYVVPLIVAEAPADSPSHLHVLFAKYIRGAMTLTLVGSLVVFPSESSPSSDISIIDPPQTGYAVTYSKFLRLDYILELLNFIVILNLELL